MTMLIQSNEDLLSAQRQGKEFKFVYFWGHRKPQQGIAKSCFSQWYEAPFYEGSKCFLTAEHYMMYQKAKTFDNHDIAEKILVCKTPGEAKKLGRNVVGFDEQIWREVRYNIVVQANVLKFSQHSDMKAFLSNTGDRILVEASPVDRIWGIGLSADDPKVEQVNQWQGLNLLGYALMKTRQLINEL
ncbi:MULTISPECIES: NADAR family protein [Vibrio]|nr:MULTISPECIES: NADAR family protein [Vibrio]